MSKNDRVIFSRRTLLALAAGTAAGALTIPASRGLAQSGPPKIGVIGSGRLGGTVGTLLAKAGHPVMFSSRHPDELKKLVEDAGPNASAGTVEQAAAFGDVILIAVPYSALPQVGRDNAESARRQGRAQCLEPRDIRATATSPKQRRKKASAKPMSNICPVRGWCGHLIQPARASSQAKRIDPAKSLAWRLPATMPAR